MKTEYATLNDAIALATRAHAGQTDKAGADYIAHPSTFGGTVGAEGESLLMIMLMLREKASGISLIRNQSNESPGHVIVPLEQNT